MNRKRKKWKKNANWQRKNFIVVVVVVRWSWHMKTVRTVVFSMDVYSPLFFLVVCCFLSFLIVSCFLFLMSCVLSSVCCFFDSCFLCHVQISKCIEMHRTLEQQSSGRRSRIVHFWQQPKPSRVLCHKQHNGSIRSEPQHVYHTNEQYLFRRHYHPRRSGPTSCIVEIR